jgi:hypothetical protein
VLGSEDFSGYMLIYIHREDAPSLMEEIADDSVPQHVKDYAAAVGANKSSEKSSISFSFVLENVLRQNAVNTVLGFWPSERQPVFALPIGATCCAIYEKIHEETGLADIRVWYCAPGRIPTDILSPEDHTFSKLHSLPLRLFVKPIDTSNRIALPARAITA